MRGSRSRGALFEIRTLDEAVKGPNVAPPSAVISTLRGFSARARTRAVRGDGLGDGRNIAAGSCRQEEHKTPIDAGNRPHGLRRA